MRPIGEALYSLSPNAVWVVRGDEIEWLSIDIPQPSDEEILNERIRLQQEYDFKEYQRLRSEKYPSFADQLDMLYHDIKNGTLNSGAWIQAIENVKSQYPKPTE